MPADTDVGQRQKIKDIREAVKNDPDLNTETMSMEMKTELIDNLLKHRAVQSHGVRVSNLAAAQDVAHTIRQIEASVSRAPEYAEFESSMSITDVWNGGQDRKLWLCILHPRPS